MAPAIVTIPQESGADPFGVQISKMIGGWDEPGIPRSFLLSQTGSPSGWPENQHLSVRLEPTQEVAETISCKLLGAFLRQIERQFADRGISDIAGAASELSFESAGETGCIREAEILGDSRN